MLSVVPGAVPSTFIGVFFAKYSVFKYILLKSIYYNLFSYGAFFWNSTFSK